MSLALRRAALALLALTAGCSWFRGAPEPPARIAERMRKDPVAYERLVAAAAEGPKRNLLWLRERQLAELSLGMTMAAVRRRHGEPTRTRRTSAGVWWEYEEVYAKPGATPTPDAKATPALPDELSEPTTGRVGMNLRLLFVDAPAPPEPSTTPTPVASPSPAATPTPAATPVPAAVATAMPEFAAEAPATPSEPPTPLPTATPAPMQLAHIQAWAPARFQTRSLVRVLDPAVRVERKYGKPPRVLPWGGEGGEVWLYPAANVGFVMTPAWEEQPRHVAGTLVGF